MAARAPDVRASLAAALTDAGVIAGSTHHFYHYPARFAPRVVRSVIEAFSAPGDLVADCFMGGGTTVIEGLAMGRRMLGVDLNALAHFVARVRTTPFHTDDEDNVRCWAEAVRACFRHARVDWVEPSGVANLPKPLDTFLGAALEIGGDLPTATQRDFSRAALLRLGQWALDGREAAVLTRRKLAARLPDLVDELLAGLQEFSKACEAAGVTATEIAGRRTLLNRNVVGLDRDPAVAGLLGQVRLVITSPPYPGVHVLYHRWQYRGRRETRAPYWVAAVQDGQGESYYTMGGRSQRGVERYYETLCAAFVSVRPLLAPDARVVQIVAFPDVAQHLPRYLAAMQAAGFHEDEAFADPRLWRPVPNRRWYHRVKDGERHGSRGAGSEVLLVHRRA